MVALEQTIVQLAGEQTMEGEIVSTNLSYDFLRTRSSFSPNVATREVSYRRRDFQS